MTALLVSDYLWGLLAFVVIAALYGRRSVTAGPSKVTARAGYF